MDGVIATDGQGYTRDDNAPDEAQGCGVGAGYGGYGGQSYTGTPAGKPYGNPYQPQDLGSGGRNCAGGGGNGGGALHLVISDTFILNGVVSANGYSGDNHPNAGGGGGSGGSIWIETLVITGSGTIQAVGGNGGSGFGNRHGGGGSGGRIVLKVTGVDTVSSQASGFQARGGWGYQYGGPGTVYLENSSGEKELRVDNGGNDGPSAGLLPGEYEFDRIKLTNYGHLTVISSTSVLTLASNEIITGNGTSRLIVPGTVVALTEFTIRKVTLVAQGRLIGPEVITTTDSGGLDLYASTPWHSGVYTYSRLNIGSGTRVNLIPYITNSPYADENLTKSAD